ncbi:MAG: L,D-transpeptidase family protein [Armatimonadota bacterium]
MHVKRVSVFLSIFFISSILMGSIGIISGFAQSNGKADMILVLKSRRQLWLIKDGEVMKSYRISLGKQPEGHKVRRGDNKTPEGRYIIDKRNPRSSYHLALHVSYPDSTDVANARRLGVSPGGNIMIHGLPNGHGSSWKTRQYKDWTAGCIAVSDRDIEEIWRLVPDGTVIDIRP